MSAPTREARHEAETGSGWYAWLARTGLVAKGISFGIMAVLAVKLAFGNGGKATSRQGALQTVSQESFGKLLLILLAVGFAAYALWRFVQAFAEREDDEGEAKGDAKKWGKRTGYVGRGLIYAGLTFTTIKILTGSGGQQSQNRQARKTAAAILDWPGGRWIVGVVGLFLVKAAADYDPKKAIGLDGALQKLVNHAYGSWLLGITAAGLFAYAVFCLVDARYRDVSMNGGGSRDVSRQRRRRYVAAA